MRTIIIKKGFQVGFVRPLLLRNEYYVDFISFAYNIPYNLDSSLILCLNKLYKL